MVAYMQRVDSGEEVDQELFVAQYPRAADDLRAYFETVEAFRRFTHKRTRPTSPSTRLTLPCPFGDYELLTEIARGGMGVVYKAHHVKLNRIVAVKMILAGNRAGRDDVERFYTEARAAATLDHAGIVPIYEVGENEGQPFYSMALVNGQSLADRVAKGPLPFRESATLVKKIAEAVEYAHQHGVVHRDLKPANVLLTGGGEPRVTDFGLAKRVEATEELTVSGQILGTPSYLPPEQAEGRLCDVGPRSDVYSLGAILYTLLTGRPPFQAATPVDTLRQVVDQQPVAPRALNSAIPRDLQTIALKCLEKDRGARYDSAAEVVEELERFLKGEPIHAHPIGPLQRSWRLVRRNRSVTALAAAAVTLVLISLVQTQHVKKALTHLGRQKAVAELEAKRAYQQAQLAQSARSEGLRAERERRRAQEVTRQTLNALKLAESRGAAAEDRIALAESRAERISTVAERTIAELAKAERRSARRAVRWADYERSISSAQRELNLGNRDRALAILDDCEPAMQSWEWSYLRSQCEATPTSSWRSPTQRDVLIHSSAVTALAVWPPGSEHRLRNAEAQILQSQSGTGPAQLLASTDRDGTVTVVDWLTGNERFSATPGPGRLRAIAIDPTGDIVAAAGDGPTIHVWKWATREKLFELVGAKDGTHCLAFNSSGLVAGGGDGSIRFWRQDGTLLKVLRRHSAPIHCLKFGHLLGTSNRPAGELLLASVDTMGVFHLWNSRGGHVTCKRRNDRVAFADIAHGPGPMAGLYLSEGTDGAVKRYPYGLQDTFRRVRRVLKSQAPSVTSQGIVKLVPKSVEQVATVYTGTRIIKGRPERTQVSDTGRRFAISPSGGLLATEDGSSVVVLDIRSGDVLLRLEGHTGKVTTLAWAPDASQLFSGSLDGTVRVWDVIGSGGRHRGTINAIALRARQHRVATASADRTTKVWNTITGELTGTLRGHAAEVAAVALVVDATQLVTAGVDGQVKLWNTDHDRCTRTFRCDISEVRSAVFSPNGTRLALAGGNNQIVVCNIDMAQTQWKIGHASATTSLTYDREGRRIAVSSADHSVRVYEAETGNLLCSLPGDGLEVTCVSFSNDGQLLACGDAAGEIRIWNVSKGVAVSDAKLDSKEIRDICFSEDDQRLLLASGSTIKVWNLATSRVLLELFASSPMKCLTIDDGLLVSADINGQIRLWPEDVRHNRVPREARR